MHRISAASCYQRSGELSRAAPLYRAALAGPLTAAVKADLMTLLAYRGSVKEEVRATLAIGKPPGKSVAVNSHAQI